MTQLLKISPHDIERFDITTLTESHSIVKTASKKWFMIKPYRAKVHHFFSHSLCNLFNPFLSERVVHQSATATQIEKMGLNQPLLKMVIHTKKKQYTLLIGRITPFGKNYYCRWTHIPQIFLLKKGLVLHIFSAYPDILNRFLFEEILDAGYFSVLWKKRGRKDILCYFKKNITLSIDGDEFVLGKENGFKLVSSLKALIFRNKIYQKKGTLNNPLYVIKKTKLSGLKIAVIKVYEIPEEKEDYVCYLEEDNLFHLLPKKILQDFDWRHFVDYDPVFPFVAKDITLLELSSSQEKWTAEQKSFQWTLRQNDQTKAAKYFFFAFIHIFENSSVEKWIDMRASFQKKHLFQMNVHVGSEKMYTYNFYNYKKRLLIESEGRFFQIDNSFKPSITFSFQKMTMDDNDEV